MPRLEDVHSPEFDLIRACVRWPQEQVDAALIRKLAQGPIRWPHLVDIVHHHKVVSLVSRNLDALAADWLPREPGSILRNGAVENARSCFQRISHLVRLAHLFREQEIDMRVFKGIPLAMAAFGDPTLRDVGDVDLLIGEGDIARAEKLLLAEGYRRYEPMARLSERRLRSYVAHQKDFSFDHPRSGISIDLHWRLFRNPWLPGNQELSTAGVAWLELGPERIPVIPADELFLYLCIHGALDGWLRLKWLADIGALLRRMSPEQVGAILSVAEKKRVLPEVSAAILLCHEMLGSDISSVAGIDRGHPRAARIVRLARHLMTSNDCRPVRERIATTVWFFNELSLHSSLKYRGELIGRSLFRPRVWETFDLADALFPLYALLSPLEWLAFRVRRAGARLKGALSAISHPSSNRQSTGRFQRLLCLAPSKLALAIEAGTMLIFFRIALKFLPVHRLTEWMGATDPARHDPPDEQVTQTLRRVEWAVAAVVRHAPLSFVCFPQALAAYFMLRRRHVASKMFYGIAREDHRLKAHTWIKVGDRTIVGGEAEPRFTILAIFP